MPFNQQMTIPCELTLHSTDRRHPDVRPAGCRAGIASRAEARVDRSGSFNRATIRWPASPATCSRSALRSRSAPDGVFTLDGPRRAGRLRRGEEDAQLRRQDGPAGPGIRQDLACKSWSTAGRSRSSATTAAWRFRME